MSEYAGQCSPCMLKRFFTALYNNSTILLLFFFFSLFYFFRTLITDFIFALLTSTVKTFK